MPLCLVSASPAQGTWEPAAPAKLPSPNYLRLRLFWAIIVCAIIGADVREREAAVLVGSKPLNQSRFTRKRRIGKCVQVRDTNREIEALFFPQ
jgi:hypothetical protein